MAWDAQLKSYDQAAPDHAALELGPDAARPVARRGGSGHIAANLRYGDGITLEVTTTVGRSSWASLVAAVTAGDVVRVGAGSASITASGFTVTARVQVAEGVPLPRDPSGWLLSRAASF